MRTIKIRVPSADLATEMAAMRKWLDERICELSRFTSRRHGNVVAVCLEFNKDHDADAFRAHFDRDMHRRTTVETLDRMAEDLEQRLAQIAQ